MNNHWRAFLPALTAILAPAQVWGQTGGGNHLQYTNSLNCKGEILICAINLTLGNTYDLIPVMKDGRKSNYFSNQGFEVVDRSQTSACWGPFSLDGFIKKEGDEPDYFTFRGSTSSGAAIEYDDKVYLKDLRPQITVTPAELTAETDPCDAKKTRIVLSVSDTGNIYYLTKQQRAHDGSLDETNEKVGKDKDGAAGQPLTWTAEDLGNPTGLQHYRLHIEVKGQPLHSYCKQTISVDFSNTQRDLPENAVNETLCSDAWSVPEAYLYDDATYTLRQGDASSRVNKREAGQPVEFTGLTAGAWTVEVSLAQCDVSFTLGKVTLHSPIALGEAFAERVEVAEGTTASWTLPATQVRQGVTYQATSGTAAPPAGVLQSRTATADGEDVTFSGLPVGTTVFWASQGDNECLTQIGTLEVAVSTGPICPEVVAAAFHAEGGGCMGQEPSLVLDDSQTGMIYYLTVGDETTPLANSEKRGADDEALTWAGAVLGTDDGADRTFRLHVYPADNEENCSRHDAWPAVTVAKAGWRVVRRASAP